MHQILLQLGAWSSAPDPALPRPPAGFKGPTSKRRGGRDKGGDEERERRGRRKGTGNGGTGRGGEGKGWEEGRGEKLEKGRK